MKKQFLFATLALATMFTACSKEEELSKNESGTPVNFVIGGIGARTTTSDTYVATFEPGDIIGLFGSGFKNDDSFTNKAYTVNQDLSGLTPPQDEPTYYMGDENPTIYAYRPYNSSNTSTTVEHIVSTDQSITQENDVTIDGFNGSDFMVATTSINGSTISLTFEHKMAMVELNFGENLSALGVTQVSMNTLRGIKYDLTTNTTTPLDGTFIVNMYNVDTNKFWAIVPPQTVTGDGTTTLFTITAGGRTFNYTPANDVTETFTANKVRKITLDIAGTGDDEPIAAVFKLASVTVNNWGTEEDENTTTVVEKKLDVTATMPNSVSVITNRSGLSDDTWGYIGLVSATVENQTITVTGQSYTTSPNWASNTLYYYAGASNYVVPGNSYKVSIVAQGKSDDANTTSVSSRIVVCQKVQENSQDVAYELDSNSSVKYVAVPVANETTYNIIVNPAKYAKVGSISDNNPWIDKSTIGDIVVAIGPNVTDGTLVIKSIKIEQVVSE